MDMPPRNRYSSSVCKVGLLVVACAVGACSDAREESREAARREVQQRIENELAARDDVPEADKAAAAAAIAQDLTDVARESAATQPKLDAANAALEQALGRSEQLAAQDCERLRVELDALQRLAASPDRERLSEAERAALPAEVERMAQVLSDRCGG